MRLKPAVWLLLAFTLAGPVRAGVERTYHVAPPPLGDDAHSGSAGAPFATLEQGRDAARAYLATHDLHGDLVIELAAGTYELTKPLRLEPADSGRNGFDVVYRAAPGATVTLSGGRRVTGWVREGEGLYRANVGQGVDFRQLWVDDCRAVRARTPNVGEMFRFAREKQANGFELPSEQLAGIALRPDEVEVSVLIAWMHKRLRIARTEPHGATTRAVIDPREWDAVTDQPQGDRVYRGRSYWLENAREFLDAPGEFFLDRADGVLRYRPRPGEDFARARVTVIRPVLENLVVLDGRLDAPVHDLRFEGLTFAHTGWTRPDQAGFVDVQANSLVPAAPAEAVDPQYRHHQRKDRIPAAFQAATADRIVVRDCRFARLGGAGIVFTHGGDDNVIAQNSFYDLAAGGIELGEDAVRPANPRLIPRRNRIVDNFISHIGADYFGSVAILGYYTDQSLIAHNEIVGVPYTGISQGWGWGRPPAPAGTGANRIRYNRVENFLRRLDDGAGIYTTDRQPGSTIAFNFIARMTPPAGPAAVGGAIYPDQFTEGFHIHDNVVVESPRWLYLWNPNIRGNHIEANYSDTTALRDDSPDNVVEAVRRLDGDDRRRWPAAARAIADSAGLEPKAIAAGTRRLAAPTTMTLESTGVDFQVLAGAWTTVPMRGMSRYGRQSLDPAAAARWMPIVPEDGVYEISVHRPAGAASATYTVHYAGAMCVVRRNSEVNGWCSLGRYRLHAGVSTEVEMARESRSSRTPLMADTLRLRLVVP
ncbi:MAG TPA: right-handed parallel beta-helix repeat-containing protein [Opitutaceae bacterium]|nr:right-handed parallel beta-helix repeat-containing protein [Opitutaceae bacterium]